MKLIKLLNFLFIAAILFGIPAGANQTVEENKTIKIGTYISNFNTSGYQISFSFDPEYLKFVSAESGKFFGAKQTYFKNVTTPGNVVAFEFIIGKDSINISGNLVNITFFTLKPVNSTNIELSQYLIADGEGRVGRDFAPFVYDSIRIIPTNTIPNPYFIPITYSGLMTLVSHFNEPLYDMTGDGNTDIEDFVKFSRQLN